MGFELTSGIAAALASAALVVYPDRFVGRVVTLPAFSTCPTLPSKTRSKVLVLYVRFLWLEALSCSLSAHGQVQSFVLIPVADGKRFQAGPVTQP